MLLPDEETWLVGGSRSLKYCVIGMGTSRVRARKRARYEV